MTTFPVSLMVTVSWHSALVPDAEGCRKAAPSAKPGATSHQEMLLALVVSPDSARAGPSPDRDAHSPGATLSEDPRPPSLDPPPGARYDMSAPRGRPRQVTQKPREARMARHKS